MLNRLAILKKLDIFGVTPNIQFNGGSKSYSRFGLIYTLITGAFVIWAVVFTSQDFVHRTNPSLTTTTMYGATVEEDLTLPHSLFQLGFGIYDNAILGNYFIDPSIYTVTANMGLYNYYPDGTCLLTLTPLDIVPCKNSNFDGNVAYYASQWCLSRTQTNFHDLFTRTEDDQFMQFDFYVCNNATSGGTCASQEVIDRWITNSDIQTTFRQSTTIASNYEDPINHFYTDQWQGLLLDKTKSMKLMLDVVEFTSDDGWLFQSEKTETIINFNPIAGDVLERREEGLFATFIIANSGNKILYHRTYMKIQDVLAQVSGLAGAAALILGLFAQPFAELKMYEKAVKDIYKIKVTKKRNPRAGLRKSSSRKTFPIATDNKNNTTTGLDDTMKTTTKLKDESTMIQNKPLETNPLADNDEEIGNPLTNSLSPEKNSISNGLYIQDLKAAHQKEVETQFNKTTFQNTNYPAAFAAVDLKPFTNNLNIPQPAGEDLDNSRNGLIDEDKEEIDMMDSDIGYFEWLFSPIKFSPKISVLNKGKDEINRYLDLLVLVKKMREVDKMEACLMKKEERILFQHIQQPVLSLDTTVQEKGSKRPEVEVTDWLVSSETPGPGGVAQAYLTAKTSDHKTRFSEKLLGIYEQERKNPADTPEIIDSSREHNDS